MSSEYLSLSDLEAAQEQDVREYYLPCDNSKKVRIRSVSVERMRQYQEQAKKGGSSERRGQCALIADSVVGLDNKPIWSADDLYNAAGKSQTRWFMALVKLVSTHNGGDDEVTEAKAEEELKN
jgi:hypothetical protein